MSGRLLRHLIAIFDFIANVSYLLRSVISSSFLVILCLFVRLFLCQLRHRLAQCAEAYLSPFTSTLIGIYNWARIALTLFSGACDFLEASPGSMRGAVKFPLGGISGPASSLIARFPNRQSRSYYQHHSSATRISLPGQDVPLTIIELIVVTNVGQLLKIELVS